MPYILAVSAVILVILCLKFYIRDKNGRIEIKLSGEIEKDENTIMATHTDLILKITYSLIRKDSRYNKEQSAVLINNLILNRCASGFKVRKNTAFKEIEEIVEQIKPLFPHETGSELISVKYRILVTMFANWPKEVFLKT